ncbi:hypothetical protein [Roseomonas chloroacetimidivorans]|uniref:hypothetical protein n=1 Tax=Roseomonas chloroacetimidivorans TaxID=1766656 RepID=UPI003C734473
MLGRKVTLGLVLTGVNFYDGQDFMVRTDSGVKSVPELNGATICMPPGTTTELNAAEYFRTRNPCFTLLRRLLHGHLLPL